MPWRLEVETYLVDVIKQSIKKDAIVFALEKLVRDLAQIEHPYKLNYYGKNSSGQTGLYVNGIIFKFELDENSHACKITSFSL